MRAAVALVESQQIGTVLAALAAFTRSRCSLVAAPSAALLAVQAGMWRAVDGAGLEPHEHYRPGTWVPHVTLTPRLPVEVLTRVARRVYDVLPLPVTFVGTALVDTGTGELYDLHP